MPDFEALIRHQQLKQQTPNQRLKVVDSDNLQKTINKKTEAGKARVAINFLSGFIGSIIGTSTIIFLYVNEFLPIDFLKIK